jgi:hypothetical protein
MTAKRHKRLLLLCGTSLLTLQLASIPFDPGDSYSGIVTRSAHAQDASCFIAGTLVLMADGSERPIETLQPGDAVLGRRGRVNRVAACERTRLGRRRLYGFNGRRPFVTAEHPFLTSEGWKSLDPAATHSENERLQISTLQLGDQLCRGFARHVGVASAAVPGKSGVLFLQSATVLEALAAVDADPATPLFNLLLDGDHSYVADGWIVHNKAGDTDGGSSGGDGGGSSGGDGGGSSGGDGGGSSGGDGGGSSGGDGGGSSGGDGASGTGASGDAAGPTGGGGPSEAGATDAGGSPAATGGQGIGPSNSPAAGASAPAQTGAAPTVGAPSVTKPDARTAKPQSGAARNQSARSALDSFLKALGFRDSRDSGLAPTGPPLSREQERRAIKQRWRQRD